jgi:hypothetical protein
LSFRRTLGLFLAIVAALLAAATALELALSSCALHTDLPVDARLNAIMAVALATIAGVLLTPQGGP